MLAEMRKGVLLLLPLTGVLLVLVNRSHALEARKSGRSDLGEDTGLRTGDSLLKKEMDQIFGYILKELAALIEKKEINLQSEWMKAIRKGVGEGVFELKKGDTDGRWYFDGFKEKLPVPMRGEPPELFNSLKKIKIFGFDAITVRLDDTEIDCLFQQYEVSSLRMLVEYSNGTATQEIVPIHSDSFYVTNVDYRKGVWTPGFKSQFYIYLYWLSCSLESDANELLAQISWFIANEIETLGGSYSNRVSWCVFLSRNRNRG